MGIAIERVLKNFDDTIDEATMEVRESNIKFITADGRLRTMHARKLVKSPKQQLGKPLDPRGGITYNLKRNGVMMMEDIDQLQPKAVKVAMITEFNGLTVYH